jgi:hypothetical protein
MLVLVTGNAQRELHGCSLKIHRVEIRVIGGKHCEVHRAADDYFDCVKTNSILKREFQSELNTANASGERPDKHSLDT